MTAKGDAPWTVVDDGGRVRYTNLSCDQIRDIGRRFSAGEPAVSICERYAIAYVTLKRYVRLLGARRPVEPPKYRGDRFTPTAQVMEFAKRVKKYLWPLDGKSRKRFNAFQERRLHLEDQEGYSFGQAIVKAAKDFPEVDGLWGLFPDIRAFDVDPSTSPEIKINRQGYGMNCEGKELTYRENLNWALNAAGEWLRTGEEPESCPNNQSYYLFVQAREEPRNFLQRVSQAESKGDGQRDEERKLEKDSKRAADDIDRMLKELGDED